MAVDDGVGWWVMAGLAKAMVQPGLALLGAGDGTGSADGGIPAPAPAPALVLSGAAEGSPASAQLPGVAVGVQPVATASRVRCGRIVELDKSIAALTAERASLLVAERDCGEWKKAGYASFEAWRGQMSGEGLRAARSQVTVATVLEESPEAAEAVATGKVTMVHAEILGRVRAKAERPGTTVLTTGENRELLDLAKGQDADTFAKTADRWWARRDSVAHDATHEEIRRKRYLTISHTPTGTHIKGFVDVVAGRRLDAALGAAMHRPEDDDDRDYAQRMADALIDVADRAINGGSFKNGAAVRPHVSIIITETSFIQGQRELHRRAALADAAVDANAEAGGDPGAGSSSGSDSGVGGGSSTAADGPNLFSSLPDGEDEDVNGIAQSCGHSPRGIESGGADGPGPVEPATFEDGTPVPLSEVARILCDCDVTRIVMTADNVPINLGRTERLYTREQRRAIIARDRGCKFTGCTQRVPWCEIHHIDWWVNGGDTSLDNAILLCSYHHHEVHRLNLTIDRTPSPAGRPGGTRTVRVTRSTARVARSTAQGTRDEACDVTRDARTPRTDECRVTQTPTHRANDRRTGIENRPPTVDRPPAVDRPLTDGRPPTADRPPATPRPPDENPHSHKKQLPKKTRPPDENQIPGDRRASNGNWIPSHDPPLGLACREELSTESRSPGKTR